MCNNINTINVNCLGVVWDGGGPAECCCIGKGDGGGGVLWQGTDGQVPMLNQIRQNKWCVVLNWSDLIIALL